MKTTELGSSLPDLRKLADQLRIRTARVGDGELIVPGRRGHVCAWEPARLAWVLTYDYRVQSPTAHLQSGAKRDPKLRLEVEGDEEAIFSFDEEDLKHVARRWCRARFRRRLSEEQKAAQVERLKAFRFRRQPQEEHELPTVDTPRGVSATPQASEPFRARGMSPSERTCLQGGNGEQG